MRRPTLPTKLIAAALPLVVAVAVLLTLTVRSDLNDAGRAESGAELGAVWDPLITALTAIEAESAEAESADSDGAPAAATRRATDQAVNDLQDETKSLGASEAAGAHITAGRSALSAARRNLDMAVVAPDLQTENDPLEAYELAGRELVAVGQLLPSEAGDPELGRQLLAVVKLAEAKLSAYDVIAGTQQWEADQSDTTPLATAHSAYGEMEATLGEFQAIAPDDWATQYRQSVYATQLARFRGDIDRALRSALTGQPATFDTTAFGELVNEVVQFQSEISQEIVERASFEADSARRTTLIRIGVSLGAVLLAALIALFITRSITRRIKAVSASANQVATEQLPALVEALRDPRGKATLPDIKPVSARGNDELSELAAAFNSMQDTLVEVAHEQIEVLRRGVSDLFVTMARRNRSLIDRQLAMLDEFEAEVDDPAVLGNYYQLDHLATRMRRNTESLLVLAGAEPKRRRIKATEIDDVVRASIGEVEDYRRVEIEHLESLQVRGTVVADVSHMIAELLDNATAFSPPESSVRVGGRRAGDTYLLRIVDSGIGIQGERLREINELLREPPVVGLSVESTLGISVVSLLANKHGITVDLSAGNPGLTVDISLPSTLFGPIDVPGAAAAPSVAAAPLDEQIVAWNDPASEVGQAVDERFAPAAEYASAELTAEPATAHASPDESPVATSDWTKMSLSLSAFQSGQKSATKAAVEPNPASEPASEPVAEQFVPTEQIPEQIPGQIPGQIADPEFIEPPQPVALPDLPPPPPAQAPRTPGEFDTPLAPPISADGPSRGPVAPATARSGPAPSPADAPPSLPNLPTRSPSSGPDGPDRLTDVTVASDDRGQSTESSPSALQSALAAFDTGRNGSGDSNGTNGSLPTRTPSGDPVPQVEQPSSATASRLDPEALRERLRSFQSEFHGSTSPGTSDDDTSDLGGDLR